MCQGTHHSFAISANNGQNTPSKCLPRAGAVDPVQPDPDPAAIEPALPRLGADLDPAAIEAIGPALPRPGADPDPAAIEPALLRPGVDPEAPWEAGATPTHSTATPSSPMTANAAVAVVGTTGGPLRT